MNYHLCDEPERSFFMTDTTSMPFCKHQVIQNVLRMPGRGAFFPVWSISAASRRASGAAESGRAADAVAGEWQVPVRNVSAQPPLDTYRIIYVPYHADREGLPLNTQGGRTPPRISWRRGWAWRRRRPELARRHTQLPSGMRAATSSRLGNRDQERSRNRSWCLR